MSTRFILSALMGGRLGANIARSLCLIAAVFAIVAPAACQAPKAPKPAKPDRLYILIDRSESMGMDPERQTRLPADIGFQRTRIGAALALAKRRGESAIAAGEHVHLITFSDGSYRNGRAGGPTFFPTCTNPEQLEATFEEAQKQVPGGMTHLWDTVCDVLERAGSTSGEFGRLSIAVYTDGKDDGSKRSPDEIQRLMNVLDRRGTSFKYVEVWSYEGAKVIDTEVPEPPPPLPPPPPPPPPTSTLRVTRMDPSRRVYSSEELKEGIRLGVSLRIQGEHHTKDVKIEVAAATKGAVSAKLDRELLQFTPKDGRIDESKTIDLSIGGQGESSTGLSEVILSWRPVGSTKFDSKAIGDPIRINITDAPSLVAVDVVGELGSNSNRLYRGDRKQFQLKLKGNPESAGQPVEVALPALPGIALESADGAWEALGNGRLRRRMPGAIRNDDDLNEENPTQPEMDLKLTLVADTALSEGLKSFIIALDIKGARQPWSQSINISPQVATFELIADLRSGIHEQPPGSPGVCGQKVTVISDNSLAAKADRLVIDGVGIPKGITVLLKDSSGVDRPLPVDVVGDNAAFDVLLGWDATKIRKEELASLTQSMKLQLRPAAAGGAKVASERSQAHLPQLAFEPIVRATIDADWGFEAPKVVEPTTPQEIRLRLDANRLALAATPLVFVAVEGGSIAGAEPGRPVSLQQSITELVIAIPPIGPGAEHLVRVNVDASFAGASKVPVGEFRRRLAAGKAVVTSRVTAAPELTIYPGDWVRVGSIELSNPSKFDVVIGLNASVPPGGQMRIASADDVTPLASLQSKTVPPGVLSLPIEMMLDGRSKGAETTNTATLELSVVDPTTARLEGQAHAEFRVALRKVSFSIYRGTNAKGLPRTVLAADDMIPAEAENGVLMTKPPKDRRSGLVGRMGDLPEDGRAKAGAMRLKVVLAAPPKGKSWKNPQIRPIWRVSGQDVATLAELQTDAGIKFESNGTAVPETIAVELKPLDGFEIQPESGRILLKPAGGGSTILWITALLVAAVVAYLYFRKVDKRLTRRFYLISTDGKKVESVQLNEYGPSSLIVNGKSGEVAVQRDPPHKPLSLTDGNEQWVVVPLDDGVEIKLPPRGEARIEMDGRECARGAPLTPKDGAVVTIGVARFVLANANESYLGRSFPPVGESR